MRSLIVWLCGVALVFATQAQKIEINTTKEKNEVLLYLDTAYDLTPQITTKDEYKGVIFKNITAQPQNKRVGGSLLSEIQVFNINGDLYVLGIGDPEQIHIDVGKAGQTLKVSFLKAQPSHLELLINKSLTLPLDQPNPSLDSEIPNQIATLPKPESFTNAQSTHANPSTLAAQNAQIAGDTQTQINEDRQIQGDQIQSDQIQNGQIQSAQATDSQAQSTQATESAQPLPLLTQSGDLDLWRYAALIGIMVLLIAILLWTRNSLRKNTHKPFASYLNPNAPRGTHFELNPFDPTIKIIAQKRVDSKNKILTIETNGYRYVVLVGNSNTLLDHYPIGNTITNPSRAQTSLLHDNLVIEDSQFSNLLEQKAQRLQRLKNDQNI
ncbi:hypothetical protein [uncultured Helicobacter sp.]|uniref:hypothetical protein n=1 Tax=uncultured Helicobacter sp. TaxID=175537 RepID=UPI00374FD4FB